jgi:hypothetical protein
MSHRYTLHRSWLGNGGVVNFIMLNPSTATEEFDDPTIRRCVGFSKRWGFSGLVVTNLFAYRATQPKDLKQLLAQNGGFRMAVGEDNASHLDREARMAHLVVCAWGDNVDSMPKWIGNRDLDIISSLRYRDLHCIRLTKKGNPAHPVREPYTENPILLHSALNTGSAA